MNILRRYYSNIKTNNYPFNIKQKIESGAFGNVYLCEYDKKTCVVKKIRNSSYNNIEYEILKKSNTNNLCKCYNKFKDEKFTYLLLPYYKNGDFYNHIINRIPLSEDNSIKYVYPMLKCIESLNKLGYVHLDIKLENFLLDDNNNLVLIDFGSSKKIGEKNVDNLFSLNKNVGTNSYMSPEVSIGYYNEKSDIWSIGVVLYILLKKKPYEDINEFLYKKEAFSEMPIFSNYLLKNMFIPKASKRKPVKTLISHIKCNNFIK